MKKSQMCFPLSLISALFIIATGILFIALDWWSYHAIQNAPITFAVSAVGAIFAIASLVRARIERDTPSTLRSVGILISWICLVIGFGVAIWSFFMFFNKTKKHAIL